MAKGRKSFKDDISGLIEQEKPPHIQSGDDIFNGIETDGQDLLVDAVDTVSDRTVEPTRPEAVQVISDVEEEPLPEVAGQESTVNPDFIRRVEEFQKRYPDKSLFDIEGMVNATVPPPSASVSTGAFLGGSGSAQPITDGENKPLDLQANHIGAEEIVAWYDMGQQLLSVFAYEYFSSPKEAIAASEQIYPKIANGSATPADRFLYEKAQEVLVGYTRRKTSFSETVAMSEDMKGRMTRLLDKTLELRNIQLSPELLIAMIALTPLVVNGGRILLEKMGFGNADEMVGKYSAFVGAKENQYWNQQNKPQ